MKFQKIEQDALSVFKDVVKKGNITFGWAILVIEDVTETTKDICESSGRGQPNMIDTLNSLSEISISKTNLVDHMKSNPLKNKFFHDSNKHKKRKLN